MLMNIRLEFITNLKLIYTCNSNHSGGELDVILLNFLLPNLIDVVNTSTRMITEQSLSRWKKVKGITKHFTNS